MEENQYLCNFSHTFLLENFSEIKKFKEIQNCFYYIDFEKKFDKAKEIEPDINIESFFRRENEFESNFDLIDDFIKPNINLISENELKRFIIEVKERSLFTKQQKEGFSLFVKDYLEKHREKIKLVDFLDDNIKKDIYLQIDVIKSKLKKYIANPYPNLRRKLEFNWNKTDIETLFYLLKKNKILNNPTSADIGNIIDSSFKYLNGIEYEDIINSRKDITDFENEKGIIKAILRLKKVLTNEDFYNH